MKTIILIDDEINLLKAYTVMLEKKGYRVLEAADAYTGLEYILMEDVDLIITDINMPKKNGLVMMKQIKRMLKYRNIPIIVLSGVGTKENVFRSIGMGVYSFLTKPCTFEKLHRAVENALNPNKIQSKKPRFATTKNKENLKDVSILTVYKNARLTDYFYEYLTERFHRVYSKKNIKEVEKVLKAKNIDLLIIEVDSISDDNFKFLFQIYDKNKYIGLPIIVISEKANELRLFFESMGFKIDRIFSKPFVYENLSEVIYNIVDQKYIRKKLKLSMIKINREINENKLQETKLVSNLKRKIDEIKKGNLNLYHNKDKLYESDGKSIRLKNFEEIEKINKEISDIKKSFMREKIELLEAEGKAKLKYASLNEEQLPNLI
ncbi:MAG: response regulator [Candidatus Helarchaeota archaeon]|nr:response regulator [Candidatus Helarchaeota archaeon]